jgi:putative Holliday junction resolvase
MTGNRIIALDLGEKRIGIAISDPDRIIASPMCVVNHVSRKTDVDAVLRIVKENEANHVVIGNALGENGEETRQSRHAQRFLEAMHAVSDLPVTLWDESFSTNTAQATRVNMGVSREKRRGHLDDLAAAIILQSYLDALRDSERE